MSAKGDIGRLKDATAKYDALLAEQNALAKTNYQPYQGAGTNALNALSNPTENFTASPGYQFRLDQGLEAVTQNKAVGGLLNSGGTLKGLNDYGQGMASSEYNNWFGQNLNLANLGLQGTNAVTQVGQNYANGVGQNALNQASGISSIKNANAAKNNALIGSVLGAGLNIASGGSFGALQSLGGLWGSVSGGAGGGIGGGMASAASAGTGGYNFGFA